MTLDPSCTALLVMDVQNNVLAMIDDGDALLTSVSGAIAAARGAGVTVGYVRVAFTDQDFAEVPATSRMGTRVSASREAFHADSPSTAIHDTVTPEPGDIVVRKVRVGPFSTTDLDAQLRARGIDTLVLAGISTAGVVLSTVRQAADLDYRLYVLADATADRDPEVHDFLLTKVFPNQAEVLTLAQFAAQLP